MSEAERKNTERRDTCRILIAEDDPEMAALLVRALAGAGYETVTCSNGLDLLRHLNFSRSGAVQDRSDLVISDIRMPGVTGLDVLRAASFSDGFPPIILITAFGDEWTHGKARYLGAVDIFDKPFDIEDLVNRVRELVPPAER
jgi:DNA-binding response OmpR family regulator